MARKLAAQVRGLSEAEFLARFGTEERCVALLLEMRWGRGFECERCGHGGFARMKKRKQVQCNRCKHQIGFTAGTVFHATKLPLTVWFSAIYHLSQSKGGMSSIELGRRLGVRQQTAWLMKQKLMRAMAARDAGKPKFDGRIEVDDAYLGGERSGGKRGRGAAGKTPIVAAVETTEDRKPRRIKLLPLEAFTKKDIAKLARAHFEASANVASDGLACFRAVEKAGCKHFPMTTGSGKRSAQWSPFKWVNTVLGNVKSSITGTYRRISPKHAHAYLASYAWRFNRRYQLDTMTERLTWACLEASPTPYRTIISGRV